MKFAYYRRLDPRRRRIYDRSDEAGIIRVPAAGELETIVARLGAALAHDDRTMTEANAQQLVDSMLRRLNVQAVSVRVLAVRPSSHSEELHGLYEFGGRRARPVITVWMRTAQRRQVVAFRTFLRTLLHEVVHHLDYQMLRLEDSLHTEGFYKRAESLYRQLAPATPTAGATDTPESAPEPASPRERSPRQPRAKSQPPARSERARASKPQAPPSVPAAPTPRRRPAPEPDEQPLLPFMT
jgi:hypothetical protein